MTALTGVDTRLRMARLYLCTDTRAEQGDFADFAAEVFAGGVDVLQVREKGLDPERELEVLQQARRAAAPHQALVSVNDDPVLAGRFAADVLHLGQTDAPPAEARRHLHRWARIGRSTHTPEQMRAADADPEVDYFCVGPVWATPTKPDYVPAGLDLVRAAAVQAPPHDPASKPWFAIGGIDQTNLEDVLVAGARRVVVVRAITRADDPRAAAHALKSRLNQAWRDDPAMTASGLVLKGSARPLGGHRAGAGHERRGG
ncbi:thiamine phosphate synthase [Auraticoccus sp. F435]|uniref:Thiamine-phosphate synthase n=1 Tax=Auraticoccus cholistanensis TaxID=2656650 RepID=A0A6A9UZA1_9ACTN|nr:thiamine phosphate synthase [Auraticoccus cholistanensis]MVA77322.1 thiamine phosphate synthase [Auraticoccus cholistanensis]